MIRLSKTELDVNSNGGLLAINRIFTSLPSINVFSKCEAKSLSNNHSYFPTVSIIKATTALMTLGKSSFEDIDAFKQDTLIKVILQRNTVPSKETLRQRIDSIASSQYAIETEDKMFWCKRTKNHGIQNTILWYYCS